MKWFYLTVLFLIASGNAICQTTQSEDVLPWSSTRKLQVEDFSIKVRDSLTAPSFAQFHIDYKLTGFDFMSKNFNKKVRHYMIKSASWIDTTANVAQLLQYEQTLFDLSEIYARQLRKEIKANRKKIGFGMKFIDELSNKILTDFSKRRIAYDTETRNGRDAIPQKQWEVQIQKELEALKEFAVPE